MKDKYNKEKNVQKRNEKSQITLAQIYNSPIPPPEVLAQYEHIQQGLINRIMVLAEKEAEHRHNIDKEYLTGAYLQQTIGQIFGFLIAIIAIFTGSYVAIKGAQFAGSVIGGSGLASLVSIFVLRQKKEAQE